MPCTAPACEHARDSPLTTVAMATPRAVCVCGSKKISACTTLSAAARAKYAIAMSKKSSSLMSTLAPA